MRSAQRRARIEKIVKKGRLFGLLLRVVIPILIIASVFLYLKLSTKYWNGHDKFSFVFKSADGSVGITILDPVLNEETTLIIPGDTQVDVARGYGTIRIKNVWQLGENEKLGGGLLSQTVTNNFLFPTNLWSSRDLSDPIKFVFGRVETNISFGDRLSASIFSFRVAGIDKTEIDLGKSQFLHKQTLADGTPGYTLQGIVNGRLTAYFADNNFGGKNLKFGITDETGSPGMANDVGAILEVLGGKVVAVDRKNLDSGFDCEVKGANPDAIQKVANLFSCKKITGISTFDLEMRIGGAFAKRF